MDGKEILDPAIDNWAIFPVVLHYKNKNGENPKGGLIPDHEVNSFYLPMVELGDEKDPLIAKAIELISGQPSIVARSVSKIFEYKPFLINPHASMMLRKIRLSNNSKVILQPFLHMLYAPHFIVDKF